jgi:hypothetical protein
LLQYFSRNLCNIGEVSAKRASCNNVVSCLTTFGSLTGRRVSFFFGQAKKNSKKIVLYSNFFGDTKKARRKKKGKSIPQSLTSTRAHNATAFRTLLCVTMNQKKAQASRKCETGAGSDYPLSFYQYNLPLTLVIPAFERTLLHFKLLIIEVGLASDPEVTMKPYNLFCNQKTLVTAWVAQKISSVEMSGIVQKP